MHFGISQADRFEHAEVYFLGRSFGNLGQLIVTLRCEEGHARQASAPGPCLLGST